jgi:hypothetical protein
MKRVYSGYDVRTYHEKLVKTIARYGLPKGAPHAWLRDPDFRASDHLYCIQPSAGIYWQCYLYAALQAAGIDHQAGLSTITLLDERWHFGAKNWKFSPTKMEYQVRRALKGLNYIVVIEFEIFRNVSYLGPPQSGSVVASDQGCTIAPHFQGLIWGSPPSRQQRAQLSGGLFGAPGVEVESIYDYPGAVRYMCKPPHKGRSVFQRLTGKIGRRPWPNMSLTLHHLMLTDLHRFCYPELTFASGQGSAVLAHANRLWRDYIPSGLRRYDFPQQPFDEIRLRRRPR